MSHHHFFVSPEDIVDGRLTLAGAEAHHAGRVLRVRVGETISAADGTGRMVTAVVARVGDTVESEIISEEHRALPDPAITLVQAVGKGDKIETVVEKATEVGVRRIVPFVAERSVVRWDAAKRQRVHERLCAIARGAAKQSGSVAIPEVSPVAPDVMGAVPDTLTVALHEASDERLRDVLPADRPRTIALVVGPEGGLSHDEVAGLRSAGARTASLGPQILRTETAGPVAAAVVGFRYGWFG